MLGGVPVSNKVSEGGRYQNFKETRKGGIHFLRTQKKETEYGKMLLSRNSPATPDALFARFAPAVLKSFQYFNTSYHTLKDVTITILEIPKSAKQELDKLERQRITKLNTFHSGLNSDAGNPEKDSGNSLSKSTTSPLREIVNSPLGHIPGKELPS